MADSIDSLTTNEFVSTSNSGMILDFCPCKTRVAFDRAFSVNWNIFVQTARRRTILFKMADLHLRFDTILTTEKS